MHSPGSGVNYKCSLLIQTQTRTCSFRRRPLKSSLAGLSALEQRFRKYLAIWGNPPRKSAVYVISPRPLRALPGLVILPTELLVCIACLLPVQLGNRINVDERGSGDGDLGMFKCWLRGTRLDHELFKFQDDILSPSPQGFIVTSRT